MFFHSGQYFSTHGIRMWTKKKANKKRVALGVGSTRHSTHHSRLFICKNVDKVKEHKVSNGVWKK